MFFSPQVIEKAHKLQKLLASRQMKLVAAESCTGGLFSAAMTEIPGASEVFERGFVTYSNESKIELLTVPTFYIEDFGAVSRETAVAMAEGALLLSKAHISVAITGLAGPDGGTEEKPVGTVFISSSVKGGSTEYEQHIFTGARSSIRFHAVEAAIDVLLRRIDTL
jgi:PncC family amidohydrolase